MERIRSLLEEKEVFLLKIKKEKEAALINARSGTLRIRNYEGRTEYYERKNPKDCNGMYLRKEEFSIAQELAQQDYDRKVLRIVEKELHEIEKFLTRLPKISETQLYENMRKERQKLIIPLKEPEKVFVEKWENVEFEGKGFSPDTPEFYTMKGERVRSKSEVLIADMLYREKIPYRYEWPIHLDGYGKVYPNFTVLNVRERKEFYWEHMGMMDEANYVEKSIQKISLYEKNEIFPGEKLIITYESRKKPLNQKEIFHMIQHYLK